MEILEFAKVKKQFRGHSLFNIEKTIPNQFMIERQPPMNNIDPLMLQLN